MRIQFTKYQALGNDFLVVEAKSAWRKGSVARRVRAMCDRRTGVGADGVLVVSPSHRGDRRVDVFNADGSWAEKSGNGLRIVAVHLHLGMTSVKKFVLEIGGRLDPVQVLRRTGRSYLVRADLGSPEFRSSAVPVRSRSEYCINQPFRIGSQSVKMTCLAVGNPHAIVIVDRFDFDWKALGAKIETAPQFPRATNVEFVKILNRSSIRVAEWERGAGATGSSGTGAAAAVCACVMLGMVERKCEVKFEPGSLYIDWQESSDSILLGGPVERVMSGVYESR